MNSILLKIFTPFLILGILLTSPSLGAVAPDEIQYQGNIMTKKWSRDSNYFLYEGL